MANAEINRIFAENLTRLLQEKGMQQLDLAKQLGTGAATVNDWVKGRSTPRTPTLKKIAEIFDCPMSDLLSDEAASDEKKSSSSEDDLKAAFFGGYADDLSEAEIDELWNDAKDYFSYRIEQRRKRRE